MPDNGLVVTGTFEGTLNLGGMNLVSAGMSDVFASRLAQDGEFDWSFRLGSNNPESALDITTNASGAILLLYAFPQEIRFYSPDGILQWTRVWEGSVSTHQGVLSDDGTSWVGGMLQAGVNVDGVAGDDFTATGAGSDLLFVKYSASGGLLDGVTFNGTSSTIVSSMTLSADGSVLAGGFYSGTLFLSQFAAPAAGSGDAFLLKLDPSDGDLLWSRKHGGVNGDTFNGLSTAGCGDVFVVGAYRSAVDFGGGALPYSGSSSTITNGVLAKYRP
jgi:hypothetical protein